MDNKEIRLRIVEAVIPIASRVEINSAEKMVDKCKELEKYVMTEPETESVDKSSRNKRGSNPKGSSDANQQNKS